MWLHIRIRLQRQWTLHRDIVPTYILTNTCSLFLYLSSYMYMLWIYIYHDWLSVKEVTLMHKGEIQEPKTHNDVIKWKHFPRYWAFVRWIHRSPVKSPHKGQWRGALMFSLICTRINGWANNRDAGDLRRHRADCDVIVMQNKETQQNRVWIRCRMTSGPHTTNRGVCLAAQGGWFQCFSHCKLIKWRRLEIAGRRWLGAK